MFKEQIENMSHRERAEMLNRVTQFVKVRNDVSSWAAQDVSQWLSLCKLDFLVSTFRKHSIDGYTLLQIKEHDL